MSDARWLDVEADALAHSDDGFDPARAVPSVEAAERLASSFPLAVERFRRSVDPETD